MLCCRGYLATYAMLNHLAGMKPGTEYVCWYICPYGMLDAVTALSGTLDA